MKSIGSAVGAALVAGCALATPASAQVATFSAINDSATGVCYNVATTVPDKLNPNVLRIGVHSGYSATSWTNTACIASTSGFHVRQMSDTIAVMVEAPEGFYISRVTFSQGGSATSSRVGQVFAGAAMVVDGEAQPAGLGGGTADLTGLHRIRVPVSFSVFLGAKINGTSGSASASVANPTLSVELLPLPSACGGTTGFRADPSCESATELEAESW